MRDDLTIARAHQILEETNILPVPQREVDPIERWRREGNELTAAREAARQERHDFEQAQRDAAAANHTDGWVAYFEQRLETERSILTDAIGDVLGQIRAELRAELRKEIAQLKAELTTRAERR